VPEEGQSIILGTPGFSFTQLRNENVIFFFFLLLKYLGFFLMSSLNWPNKLILQRFLHCFFICCCYSRTFSLLPKQTKHRNFLLDKCYSDIFIIKQVFQTPATKLEHLVVFSDKNPQIITDLCLTSSTKLES